VPSELVRAGCENGVVEQDENMSACLISPWQFHHHTSKTHDDRPIVSFKAIGLIKSCIVVLSTACLALVSLHCTRDGPSNNGPGSLGALWIFAIDLLFRIQ